MNADIVATSPMMPLVFDNTQVQDGISTHTLADGTISFSGELPAAALDFIAMPTASALLTDGSFVIAGTGPLDIGTGDANIETRVLKLNADLTTITQVIILNRNPVYPANLKDEVFALYPIEEGRVKIIYANYSRNSITETSRLELSNSVPEIYSNITYQLIVENLGTETATDLTIDFDYGAQDSPKSLALVNNSNPDYNDWSGIWNL